MRAWLFGLLLAVMTVQSAWASAAVFCRHDADVTARHVGHHEHRHASAPGQVDSTTAPDPASGGSIDNDCSFCHLSLAQPLPAAAAEPALVAAAQPLSAAPPRLYSSRDRERIDRPNWSGLVCSASPEEHRII